MKNSFFIFIQFMKFVNNLTLPDYGHQFWINKMSQVRETTRINRLVLWLAFNDQFKIGHFGLANVSESAS